MDDSLQEKDVSIKEESIEIEESEEVEEKLQEGMWFYLFIFFLSYVTVYKYLYVHIL